jgi:tape measure domain-containing protein
VIIDELIAILGYDVRGEANLAKFNQGLDRAAQRAQVTAQRLNAISVAIGSFAGMAAFAAVNRLGSAIGSLPGQVIDTGKTFEALQIRLETLEGSSDKAEKAMLWIKQFAKDTPLELAQVADSYADLKNFGLDPTAGSLQALTDAMSASGKGTQMLGRLTLAIGQAWVKQRLQGGEILQLTEAGIPVWDMLAEATGKNVQELQKLSSAGKLGRKEIQLLIDAIGRKYTGASEKFSKTFEGITSKLGDEWTDFLRKVSEAGFYDDIKRRLEGSLEIVERWQKDGTLDRWANGLSNAMTGVVGFGSHVGSRLMDIGGAAIDAAHGIAQLVSSVTGLNASTATGVLGAAVGAAILGRSALGRGIMLALAKKVPWIAAILAIDDIVGAAKGEKSLIGDWLGVENVDAVRTSLSGILTNLQEIAGFKFPEDDPVSQKLGLWATWGQQAGEGLKLFAAGLKSLTDIAVGKDETKVLPPDDPYMYSEDEEPGRFDPNRAAPGSMGQPGTKRVDDGPIIFTPDAEDLKWLLQNMEGAAANYQANTDRMDGAGEAVVEDHRVDSRDQSVTVSVGGVRVEVQSPDAAPAATGAAVGTAVGNAAADSAQINTEPAF